MPDLQQYIDQLTYPHLDTKGRVIHVLEFHAERDEAYSTERVVRNQSKLLGLLVARLEESGTLSADEINELLVDTAL